MTIVYIIILFFLCAVLYRPGFKFFLLWFAICASVFVWIDQSAALWGVTVVYGIMADDTSASTSTKRTLTSRPQHRNTSRSIQLYDKVYEDGSYRVENLSKTGYYYSDGAESWVGMFDEEHRSNGEVVRDNAYLSGRRDIYNANGEYIGYEYEDALGITRRVDK